MRPGPPAVFLDRDGVINRRRLDHVKSWAEFEFLPGAVEALAQLRRMGLRSIVITNQSAVGRGLLTQEQLSSIHRQMTSHITEAGGVIERIYVCSHTPNANCGCRKPETELFLRASYELGIELAGSIMIGDSRTDVEAAHAIGSLAILVAENGEAKRDNGVPVVRDLAQAVSLIPKLQRNREASRC
jgi:D-glycero-D-manno-heptose 1,7-bisphosphate phosphatase